MSPLSLTHSLSLHFSLSLSLSLSLRHVVEKHVERLTNSVMSLIAYFNLDPNRVLDVILDALEVSLSLARSLALSSSLARSLSLARAHSMYLSLSL